jgi:6-phosphogluconolactonase
VKSAVEIVVADDPAGSAAKLLAEATRRGGHIALSGGSTPVPAYERAAVIEPDWSRAELWFCDERLVPPDDERSNYLLVERSLVGRLATPPHLVHRVPTELGAELAAREYDMDVRDVTFDLALNGIGPDGHTASLFPRSPALEEEERCAVAAAAGLEPFVERVTLTPTVFARSMLLVYLAIGAEKADAVRRAFAEPPGNETPASLVRGRKTVALLDHAAASRLS